MFRMCWKHEDFPKHSEGPILRHSDRGRLSKGPPYTEREADRICLRYNQKTKKSLVRHWIEAVPVLT